MICDCDNSYRPLGFDPFRFSRVYALGRDREIYLFPFLSFLELVFFINHTLLKKISVENVIYFY